MNASSTDLQSHVRTVSDWPVPGVQFRDVTPLFQDAALLRELTGRLASRYRDPALRPECVAGLDARGFIVGAALAYALGLGFVPIRKQGKLPWRTISETYQLEYGSATLELHTDAVRPGERVLLVDDLIATGGTMMAGKRLLERLGAEVIEAAVIVDLPELGGADRLRAAGLRLHSLMSFAGH